MVTEPEAYSPDVLAEEEPRYLRRQRPVEIRRRKFGRRSWRLYTRVLVGVVFAMLGGWLAYRTAHFLLYSPWMILARPQQIELLGNHYVSRAAVLEKFFPDRGHSVLRIPLDARRKALEEIPWVQEAAVGRLLPNRVRVELLERTPVAFLRLGTELALVDGYGVILERPLVGDFRFPVVDGIAETMPREARELRMRLYAQFLKDIEFVRTGASERVSEVDLSDAKDLRATLAGLPELRAADGDGQGAVLVHFGDADFVNKYRLFVENIGQWRATAGRVDSVDLRFARQVVVNPESKTAANRIPRRSAARVKRR